MVQYLIYSTTWSRSLLKSSTAYITCDTVPRTRYTYPPATVTRGQVYNITHMVYSIFDTVLHNVHTKFLLYISKPTLAHASPIAKVPHVHRLTCPDTRSRLQPTHHPGRLVLRGDCRADKCLATLLPRPTWCLSPDHHFFLHQAYA